MNKFANINELDFSSIVSANSLLSNITHNSSITNSTINADNFDRGSTKDSQLNDDLLTNNKASVNVENVDYNLLNYLNQEFLELGLESIYSNRSGNIDFSLVFKNSIESLERFKRQLILNDRIQEK
jgi:hypothetical protein